MTLVWKLESRIVKLLYSNTTSKVIQLQTLPSEDDLAVHKLWTRFSYARRLCSTHTQIDLSVVQDLSL